MAEGCQDEVPSRAEIAEWCRKFQESWTPEEEQLRRAGRKPLPLEFRRATGFCSKMDRENAPGCNAMDADEV